MPLFLARSRATLFCLPAHDCLLISHPLDHTSHLFQRSVEKRTVPPIELAEFRHQLGLVSED